MRALFLIALLGGCDLSSITDFIMMKQSDMATDQWWRPGTALPSARQAAATVAFQGKVFVVGGLDANGAPLATVSALENKKWNDQPALPEPLYSANAAVVGDKLFVLGGLSAGDTAVAHTYAFDGTSWSALTPMPAARGAAMIATIDTKIYVAGGWRGGAVDDFAAYDTAADSWSPLPALPSAFDHGGGVAVGGTFYAVGRELDAFDPASGSWSSRTAPPTERSDFAAVSVSDSFIVAGGLGSEISGAVERYTPSLDRWSLLAPMPTPRHALGAAFLEGAIHFPGGADQSGVHPVAADEVLQP